ncbi:hypothetical protein LCGC14_0203600 [marine sediment metagenome]|uniref:Glycosyltransferase RgtA/B/C/D-like domain-containing protein n=1 Tax=marine sediment metagenome TaxID=412755 RepID=A0A0F9UZB9_9ZZZZ|nr:hypothetical protein [Phycisphaerae bacterium]HDZ43264.1 hypothetical protein [Phycisphaerae bacterium]
MKNRALWIILAVALVLRGGLFVAAACNREGVLTPDSHGYWQLATSMAEQGRFTRDGKAEIFRTPGYPVFLAALRPVAGWRAVLAAQVLLDVALVALTFVLGRMLAGPAVGLVAAGLQAVSPLAIAGSCRILSDGLYALLLTAAVVLLIGGFRSRRWGPLVIAALVAAAACYVRPAGLAVVIIMTGVVLFRGGGLARAGVFAAIAAACLVPWVVRNARVADYLGFSSFATDSLDRFAAAEIIARRSGRSVDQVRWQLDNELDGQALATPGEAARYRSRRAIETLVSNRALYLRVHLTGSLVAMLPGATDVLEVAGVTSGQQGTLAVLHRRGLWPAVAHYFGGSPWAAVVAAPLVAVWLIRLLGGLICAALKARWRMSASAWLILLVVCGAILIGGPASTPRFRLPIEPLISVAAALGLALAARGIRPDQRDG